MKDYFRLVLRFMGKLLGKLSSILLVVTFISSGLTLLFTLISGMFKVVFGVVPKALSNILGASTFFAVLGFVLLGYMWVVNWIGSLFVMESNDTQVDDSMRFFIGSVLFWGLAYPIYFYVRYVYSSVVIY